MAMEELLNYMREDLKRTRKSEENHPDLDYRRHYAGARIKLELYIEMIENLT